MWRAAGRASEWAAGSGRTVELEGKKIALFHSGGKFYALADACIHRGGPLGQGHLEEGRVTCPWHAWDFEVKSGKCLTMEGAKQPVFPVKVENGELFVDL